MKRYILVGNKIKKLREFLFIKFYTTVKEFTNIEDAKNEFKKIKIQEHNINLHNTISKKSIENLLKYYGFCESSYNDVWILDDEKQHTLIKVSIRLIKQDFTGNYFYVFYYESCYVDEFLNSHLKPKSNVRLHDKDMFKFNNSLYEIATIDNIEEIIVKYNEAKQYEEYEENKS